MYYKSSCVKNRYNIHVCSTHLLVSPFSIVFASNQSKWCYQRDLGWAQIRADQCHRREMKEATAKSFVFWMGSLAHDFYGRHFFCPWLLTFVHRDVCVCILFFTNTNVTARTWFQSSKLMAENFFISKKKRFISEILDFSRTIHFWLISCLSVKLTD